MSSILHDSPGSLHKEHGFREDPMHQSESDLFFYHLCLAVELPPGTEITLDLGTERYVNEPSYSGPW